MTGYGARPVSADLVRGLTLRPLAATADRAPVVSTRERLTYQQVADRLALAHWPTGHQITICSLTGGTGRTTVSGLLARALAELPYAHVRPPVALLEAVPDRFSETRDRWGHHPGVGAEGSHGQQRSPDQARLVVLDGQPSPAERRAYSVLIVDSPAGVPADLETVTADSTGSVILVVRPDVASLRRAAEALVWMNDRSAVHRRRVVTVVNEGVGAADPGRKSATAALWIRCAAVHSLPAHPSLGPGRALPCGHALPRAIRRSVNRLALDLWRQAHPEPDQQPIHPQETR